MQTQQILLLCGMIAGPLFLIVFLIEGALRAGYNALRQPVSALALGNRGWVQRVNFMATGVLMLACAFGLHLAPLSHSSFWAPFLIGLYALGLIGAGIFVTDVTGLPAAISTPAKRDVSGVIHDLFSLIVFVSLFVACFVFAHLFAISGSSSWEIYSVVTGILFAIGFLLFARGFASTSRLASIAGLLQRLTIAIGWIWIALVAAHLLGIY
jgi:hypothetical protein